VGKELVLGVTVDYTFTTSGYDFRQPFPQRIEESRLIDVEPGSPCAVWVTATVTGLNRAYGVLFGVVRG
jgi:hypothetical protein